VTPNGDDLICVALENLIQDVESEEKTREKEKLIGGCTEFNRFCIDYWD
jgi:hypothetical protein